jgi:myo-inositol-1-phosphate synthase
MTTVQVESASVKYTDSTIESNYEYHTTVVEKEGTTLRVKPLVQLLKFRTQRVVPKVGIMLVGLGGNNGSTVVGGVIANKLGMTWNTRRGEQAAN